MLCLEIFRFSLVANLLEKGFFNFIKWKEVDVRKKFKDKFASIFLHKKESKNYSNKINPSMTYLNFDVKNDCFFLIGNRNLMYTFIFFNNNFFFCNTQFTNILKRNKKMFCYNF